MAAHKPSKLIVTSHETNIDTDMLISYLKIQFGALCLGIDKVPEQEKTLVVSLTFTPRKETLTEKFKDLEITYRRLVEGVETADIQKYNQVVALLMDRKKALDCALLKKSKGPKRLKKKPSAIQHLVAIESTSAPKSRKINFSAPLIGESQLEDEDDDEDMLDE